MSKPIPTIDQHTKKFIFKQLGTVIMKSEEIIKAVQNNDDAKAYNLHDEIEEIIKEVMDEVNML